MTTFTHAPLPPVDDRLTLRYGAGGRSTRALVQSLLGIGFGPSGPDVVGLDAFDDGAAFRIAEGWLVMTTDAHVVQPAFFPGGDMGRLAVCGTVNDLAMMGATRVLGLSSAVVIEEGYARDDLARLVASMRAACNEAGTTIVTGDTKVMGRGELDGVVITTSGLGIARRVVRDNGLRPGDRLVVTGSVGDHGIAVMAARHDLALEGPLLSDVAPLNDLVRRLLEVAGDGVVAMKDPTRGGVASALHEMAQKGGVGVLVRERDVPVRPAVRAASELLGLDPLHLANEGKAIVGLRGDDCVARALEAMRAHPLGRDAAVVATCVDDFHGGVVLDTGFGKRLLAEPDGELVPRIC